MLIFVKTVSGKTISLDVEKTDTIEALKGKIAEREGVPVVRQKLVFAGKPLENGRTVVDCNIDKEAIVHLILVDAPAPPPAPAAAAYVAPPPPADLTLSKEKKEELLASFARDARSNKVEIVFSFDTTGSMASVLGQVRAQVSNTVTRLLKDIPDIRIGIIAHGDYCDANGSYVLMKLDLTNDVRSICDFVNHVGATGGGDAPECYELALHEARFLDWTEGSARALVVIGDCPPHPPSYTSERIDWLRDVELLAGMGVKIYGVRANSSAEAGPFYEELSIRTGSISINFQSFNLIVQMFLAICYREAGANKLEQFEKEIATDGKMTTELKGIMETLNKKNPEKSATSPADKFRASLPWYNYGIDRSAQAFYFDEKKYTWTPGMSAKSRDSDDDRTYCAPVPGRRGVFASGLAGGVSVPKLGKTESTKAPVAGAVSPASAAPVPPLSPASAGAASPASAAAAAPAAPVSPSASSKSVSMSESDRRGSRKSIIGKLTFGLL